MQNFPRVYNIIESLQQQRGGWRFGSEGNVSEQVSLWAK